MARSQTPKIFGPNNHSIYKVKWKNISNNLKQKIANVIQQNYSFTAIDIKSIRQVDEWEKRSNNFRITVWNGKKRKRVLLHKHIQKRDESDLILVEKTLDYLRACKIRVPITIPSRKKEKILFHSDGHYYRLFEFVEGDHFRGTEKELKEIASSLAKLHKMLLNTPFYNEIYDRFKPIDIQKPLSWKQLLRSMPEKGNKKINKQIKQNSLSLMDTCKKTYGILSKGYKPRIQVIRGDLHPQDTIFLNEKLNAFIDFDNIRVGELARDVFNACHRFVRQFVVYQRKNWQITLSDGVSIFMKSYNKINRLTRSETLMAEVLIEDEILKKLFSDLNKYINYRNDEFVTGGELAKKLILLREASLVGQEIIDQQKELN